MSSDRKVIVKLHVSVGSNVAGETCSLPEGLANRLINNRPPMATLVEGEVEDPKRFGSSFVRKLNRIDRMRKRKKAARREAAAQRAE